MDLKLFTLNGKIPGGSTYLPQTHLLKLWTKAMANCVTIASLHNYISVIKHCTYTTSWLGLDKNREVAFNIYSDIHTALAFQVLF